MQPLNICRDAEPHIELVVVEHQRPADQIIRLRDGRARREHDRGRDQISHARKLARAVVLPALAAALIAACHDDVAEVDGAFYDGDGRLVHCAIDLDTEANNSEASVDTGLDRARDRGEVVELYTHHPGVTVPIEKIEHVLAGAKARGLSFVTYGDYARGQYQKGTPGLALSFDDTFVEAWVALRPLFQQYGARITFFVSHYISLSEEAHQGLETLAADGHDIEAHTVLHLRGPDYVENLGLAAYLDNEVDPSIKVLRDAGFDTNAFAYPYGARTSETDRAIGKRVPVIRSVSFTYTIIESPCPH